LLRKSYQQNMLNKEGVSVMQKQAWVGVGIVAGLWMTVAWAVNDVPGDAPQEDQLNQPAATPPATPPAPMTTATTKDAQRVEATAKLNGTWAIECYHGN
jgi:hypothetical protein